MSDPTYRADIDGLRGIAVLLVIFFHVELLGVTGGFVGVDVFFVVSGYLITRLITTQIGGGNFSFGTFYVRRIRRLFPAAFVTLVACTFFAFLLFSPQHMHRLSGASISTLFFSSNFYFWSEHGYFDTASTFKPLLHTWSLSIEEQFYLIWPATLFLLARAPRRATPVAIFLVGLASLLACQYFLPTHAEAVFYLAPFRAVEFALGGLMVYVCEFKLRSNAVHELLLLIGLGLVVYSSFALDAASVFPGMAAMVPCLGTALAIYSGQARYAGIVLRNRVAVGVGLISYSLYLVHWPGLVFYKYALFRDLSVSEKVGVVVASVLIASAMYRFVETPFRRPREDSWFRDPRVFVRSCAALALLYLIPLSHGWSSDGWEFRAQEAAGMIKRARADYRSKETCPDFERVRTGFFTTTSLCETVHQKKFVIIGDSHAMALSNGMALAVERGEPVSVRAFHSLETLPLLGVHTFNESKPVKGMLQRAIRPAFEMAARDDATVVLHAIWSAYWNVLPMAHETQKRKWIRLVSDIETAPALESDSRRNFMAGLEQTLLLAEKSNLEVVIIGSLPNLANDLPQCINRPSYVVTLRSPYDCYGITYAEQMKRIGGVNEVLALEAAKYDNVRFVDPSEIFCDPDQQRCESIRDGRLLYRDWHHLSADGAYWLLQRAGLVAREEELEPPDGARVSERRPGSPVSSPTDAPPSESPSDS